MGSIDSRLPLVPVGLPLAGRGRTVRNMKTARVLLLLAALPFASIHAQTRPAEAPAAPAVATADEEAIRRAALDYIEGWYDGDAKRMERALHPELVKRILLVDEKTHRPRISGMGASALVAGTEAGGGKATPRDKVRKEVTILDVYGNAASVKIRATDWVDYLHLVKWNGEWKILNVLWER